MDCMTPSNSLFLANTTKAAFARGPLTCGSRQPTAKGLSYFSLIFLHVVSHVHDAAATRTTVPYLRRGACRHVHNTLRVWRLHEKNYDYDYYKTWKQEHQAQGNGNGRGSLQSYPAAEERQSGGCFICAKREVVISVEARLCGWQPLCQIL